MTTIYGQLSCLIYSNKVLSASYLLCLFVAGIESQTSPTSSRWPQRQICSHVLESSESLSRILFEKNHPVHAWKAECCLLSLTWAVSGLHARIQKKEGSLLVTDLDSTNGTFIDNRKLKPGVATAVSPGSCIIFGICPHSQHIYVCPLWFPTSYFSSPISGFSWSRMSNDKLHECYNRQSFLWIAIVLIIPWISFSLIGDTRLARFLVSKVQTAEASTEAEEPEEKPEPENWG